MKNAGRTWKKDGFLMRLAVKTDAEKYYRHNFNPLDAQIARFTGCKPSFTHDEVVDFFHRCVDADDRYDFMIISPEGEIIGESIINEIDTGLRSANFRICIFHSEECGKGIGSWAIRNAMEYAFEEIGLHRLELDVFSFNLRAVRAYENAGFRHEGVLRDAVKDGEKYADDILMAILEEEWRELYRKE